MEPETKHIFPFVLSTLSQKPEYRASRKKLFRELKQVLVDEDIDAKGLRKDFDEALEIGEDLGIFHLNETNVKLPFSPNTMSSVVRARSNPGLVCTDKDNDNDSGEPFDRHRSHRRRHGRGRSSSRRRRRSTRSRSRRRRRH